MTGGVQTWEVKSMSRREITYIVRMNRLGELSCSCAHFTYRCAPKGEGAYCKHCNYVLAEGLRRHHRWHRHGVQGARLLAAMEGTNGH